MAAEFYDTMADLPLIGKYMMSFWLKLKNETADEHQQEHVCKKPINPDAEAFYRFIMIAAAVLIVALVLLKQWRRSQEDGWCKKLAVIWPVDLIGQRNHRFPYVAAFNVTAWSIFAVVTDTNPLGLTTTIKPLQSLTKLATCLLLATMFYPVFGAISSDHIIGYALGGLYMWALTVVYAMMAYPCESDKTSVVVYSTLQFLPCLLWMLYLCLYFPVKIVTDLRDSKKNTTHACKTMTFESEYVRRLINMKKESPIPYRLSCGKPGTCIEKVTGWVFRKIYAPIDGYRYPVSMLTATSVSVLLLWVITLEFLKTYRQLEFVAALLLVSAFADDVGAVASVAYDVTNWNWTSSVSNVAYGVSMAKYVYYAIYVAMYFSLGGALLLNMVNMLLTMRNYRKNILEVYKGVAKNLPSMKKKTPWDVVVSGSKYVGYQFAYSLWGFFVQAVFLCICLVVLAVVVTLLILMRQYQYFKDAVAYWAPFFVYIYGLLVVQLLLVFFLFLQKNDNGKRVLAIKRRLAFLNFQYFMVFINSALGLVACLVRILKAIFFGTFTLSRLDISSLSRSFEVFDNGFYSYVCLLAIENAQTNPIVVTFVDMLQEVAVRKKFRELCTGQFLKQQNGGEALVLAESGNIFPLTKTNSTTPARRKLLVRNRWQVLLTLFNNPYLKFYRMRNTGSKLGETAFAVATQMMLVERMLLAHKKKIVELEKPNEDEDCTRIMVE